MNLTGQMLAAAAVPGLLAAGLWWLRRRGWAGAAPRGRSPGRRLQTLERLALSPQHTLHLVRVGEEELLVACAPGHCGVLARIPARPFGADLGVER